MVDFYHQLGFRFNWNLDSLRKDMTGDGVIIGPRYMSPGDVASIGLEIRSSSFFDPQFFLPYSRCGKLCDYHFFPDVISGGFSSSEYSREIALESARLCLQFQIDHDFRYLVIPTRFREAIPSDYIASQMHLFVEPFMQAYSELNSNIPILLQLILNEHMLKESSFFNLVLNWVTSLSQLQGVYIILHRHAVRKQINDIDLLIAYLSMIASLRRNDLQVFLGYLNTEAIPLLAADPTGIATGSYENLRMFGLRNFTEEERGPIHGPNARIYIPRLCNWIEHPFIGAFRRVISDVSTFVGDSPYRIEMFNPKYKWHFTKPQPYKHYFFVFSDQIKNLALTDLSLRFQAISDTIRSALAEYENLERRGIVFGIDNDSRHLSSWLTALNLFQAEFGL